MKEVSKNFVFKKQFEEITPKRVGVVLQGLEKKLGSLDPFYLPDTELSTLGEVNSSAIAQMEESEMAEYLNTFLQDIQNESKNPQNLMAHTMFRAVLTHAVRSV